MALSKKGLLLVVALWMCILSTTCWTTVHAFTTLTSKNRSSVGASRTTTTTKKINASRTIGGSTTSSSRSRSSSRLQTQSRQARTNNDKLVSSNTYSDSISIVKKVLPIFAGLLLLKTAPTDTILESINTLFYQFTYLAAFIVCGIKATLADYIAQKSASSTTSSTSSSGDDDDVAVSPFEYKRNIAFLFYGGLYQGCFQEFLFNHIFPLLFGTGTDILTVITKVSFDMLVVSPFLCLPVAYVIKGFIYQQSIVNSITRYVQDVKENNLLKKYWMLWSPAQLLTFGVIPEHFRITFIAVISFFWLIILSSISGKKSATA